MNDVKTLTALLLARQAVPREHALVRRLWTDTLFRDEVARTLAPCGLRLVENPYAAHVAVALDPQLESRVFGQTDTWQNNTMNLPRDAVALLIVLWALIILPKRERQIARHQVDGTGQEDMFSYDTPIERGPRVSGVVHYRTLLADFGDRLGRKVRIDVNLRLLERFGFIERRGDDIAEGALLDLLLDYEVLAPRIIDGALASILVRQREDAERLHAAHIPLFEGEVSPSEPG